MPRSIGLERSCSHACGSRISDIGRISGIGRESELNVVANEFSEVAVYDCIGSSCFKTVSAGDSIRLEDTASAAGNGFVHTYECLKASGKRLIIAFAAACGCMCAVVGGTDAGS